jgi:hypothetical protein
MQLRHQRKFPFLSTCEHWIHQYQAEGKFSGFLFPIGKGQQCQRLLPLLQEHVTWPMWVATLIGFVGIVRAEQMQASLMWEHARLQVL